MIDLDEAALRRALRMAAELVEFYEPEQVTNWFFLPQKIIHNKRPVDVLDDADEWDRVVARIAALRDGAFL